MNNAKKPSKSDAPTSHNACGVSSHIVDTGCSMKGISINGKYLHKITIPLEPFENCDSVVYLCYPKHRIEFEQCDNLIKLTLPVKMALEMYRVGVLPQDESVYVPIVISGKSIGKFKVIELLYPNSNKHEDNIFITFLKY